MVSPGKPNGRRRRYPGGSAATGSSVAGSSGSAGSDVDDADDADDDADARTVKKRLRVAGALLADYNLMCAIVDQHCTNRVTDDILEAWESRVSAFLLGRPGPGEY